MSPADRKGDKAATAWGRGRKASPELERLRRGEITLEQYLDARVDAATQHLRGRVTGERLLMVRDVVRQSLSSDPVAQEYVRRLVKPEGER